MLCKTEQSVMLAVTMIVMGTN